MPTASDKRRFPRYPINFVLFPVLIEAPELAEFMLDPQDISMGGFRVVVPEKPEPGDTFYCTIELKGKKYDECEVRVAWVHQNEAIPSTWAVGLSLRVPPERRPEFEGVMHQVLADLGREP